MSHERLREYRRRRSFEQTPEPSGDESAAAEHQGDRFVVQEHHARRLHWDFRLERDGVLVSWALPRGFPDDPKKNRLAVSTEDHPLEYLDFAGTIPAGEYGAGTMAIWDRGTYQAEKFRENEVIVTVHGSRVRGKFALFQTNGKNWMIHRMGEAVRDPDPMPSSIRPMRASTGSRLPNNQQEWAFEVEWTGTRAIAYAEPGHIRLTDADLRDVTSSFPRWEKLARSIGARKAILDGVLIPARNREDSTYVIVDLLYLDGHSLLERTYRQRRDALANLELSGSHWQTVDSYPGDGTVIRDAAREHGFRALVAKRLDGPYSPGERTDDWRVIPIVKSG